jgi:hypothetical protein
MKLLRAPSLSRYRVIIFPDRSMKEKALKIPNTVNTRRPALFSAAV